MAGDSIILELLGELTLRRIALLVAALIVLKILWQFFYNAYFHPLAKFPGPRIYGATVLPSMLQSIKGNVVHDWTALHDKYGDVVRVAPNELSYTSSQAWHDIYTQRPGVGQMPKYGGSENNSEGFGRLNMVNATIEDHSRYRRLVSHAFSDKAIREQEPIIHEYVNTLIAKLHERKDQPIDIGAWFNFTTFDLVGDLVFSDSFRCLSSETYHPWISMIFDNLKLIVFANAARTVPGLTNILMSFTPKKTLEEGKAHLELAKEQANKRIAMNTDRPDIMSYILRHNGKETGMNTQEIQAQAYVIVIGGSETTATLLSGAVYYLCKNPEALRRLNEEVRSSFARDEDINFNSTSQLKYLLAVLNESLRIYPPVPGNLARAVPSRGAIIDGQFVPGGTGVSVCHWATYHSSRNFKDPYTFVPERWLDGNQEYTSDNKNAFQPFSIGPRNCVGRNLAYMEMRIILAKVVWNFDMELLPQSEEWAKQRVFILWEKGPLLVKLTKRS